MRRTVAAALLALACAACGTPAPPEPQWRPAARGALADYVRLRLEGAPAAARAYRVAQERMRDGGDLDGLHTVLLARCALDVALLAAPDCGDFMRRGEGARGEALAYQRLLAGTLRDGDIGALPERYRAFARAMAGNASPQAAVAAIGDPVSRLIATGVAQRAQRADAEMLAASSLLAREQGWRAAHRVHEEARARLLEQAGRGAEAAAVRARLRALYDTAPP